jgi:GT2 family glycosyltransferase
VQTSIHNPPTPLADADLPSIVIGILSYNRRDEVMLSLESFTRINYPAGKVRLVVLDNASSDGTAQAVAERYGERVEVMVLPENLGGVARNRIMLGSPERYVFSFDEDCTPRTPDTVRNVVEFLEANPYFGAVCFRSVNLHSGATEFGNMGVLARRRLRSGAYEGMFVLGAGMCYRSSAISRTRGYDERMFWGGEEYALGLELLYHDVPVALDTRFTLIHRQAPRAITAGRVLESDTRNNIWCAFKFFPFPLAVVVAVVHTARRLLTSILRRQGAGPTPVLRGVREALRGLPGLMPVRTPIPIERLARHNRWFFQMFYALRERRSIDHAQIP